MGKTQIVKTVNKIVTVTGNVFYNERRRRIDLKKPASDLFHEASSKVAYVMEVCSSKEQALKRIELLSEQCTLPVLLYFTQEEEDPNALL